MENLIPFQAILSSPNSAWAITTIILIVYLVQDGKAREKRLTDIIDGTLKEITTVLNSLNFCVTDIKKDVEELKRGDTLP